MREGRILTFGFCLTVEILKRECGAGDYSEMLGSQRLVSTSLILDINLPFYGKYSFLLFKYFIFTFLIYFGQFFFKQCK